MPTIRGPASQPRERTGTELRAARPSDITAPDPASAGPAREEDPRGRSPLDVRPRGTRVEPAGPTSGAGHGDREPARVRERRVRERPCRMSATWGSPARPGVPAAASVPGDSTTGRDDRPTRSTRRDLGDGASGTVPAVARYRTGTSGSAEAQPRIQAIWQHRPWQPEPRGRRGSATAPAGSRAGRRPATTATAGPATDHQPEDEGRAGRDRDDRPLVERQGLCREEGPTVAPRVARDRGADLVQPVAESIVEDGPRRRLEAGTPERGLGLERLQAQDPPRQDWYHDRCGAEKHVSTTSAARGRHRRARRRRR